MKYVLTLLLFASSGWLHLQAEEGGIEEKARDIIRAQTDFLKGAERFKVSITSEMAMKMGDRDQALDTATELVVMRPNKFLLTLHRAGDTAVLSSDGESLVFSAPALSERILKMEAPESFQHLFEERTFLMLFGAIASEGMELLPVFLSSDPYETFIDEVDSLTWVGEENVNGQISDRIRGAQAQLDWDAWVTQSEPRSLVRFVPDYTKTIALMAEQMPGLDDLELHAESKFGVLELNPELPEDYFRFEIPEGTDVVDSLEALAGQPAAQDDASASLTGKPASEFSLPDLDGNDVSIPEAYEGQIIVLDFWASWCGPCVVALPELQAVTDAFKDKGVKLLAVNLREDKGTITSFLSSKDLDVTVLMDEKGAVAEDYLVTGIPQTVVIDPKGIVTSVHVGYDPDIQNVLRSEFESLLDSSKE